MYNFLTEIFPEENFQESRESPQRLDERSEGKRRFEETSVQKMESSPRTRDYSYQRSLPRYEEERTTLRELLCKFRIQNKNY